MKFNSIQNKFCLTALASACALGSSTHLVAQENFSDSSSDIQDDNPFFEEILIIGEKRKRTEQETVSSVSVISDEDISKSTIETVYDILQQTAGVSAAGDFSFSIRGINSEGQSNAGSSVASIYVDGAVMSTEGAGKAGPLSMWDIEQVEVFRGSQATSQGRNALAGAVVIKSMDPSFIWEGKAQTSFGNLGSHRTSAAISGPIVDNELAFRLSVDKNHTDGAAENVTLNIDDWALEDREIARAKLLWEPAGIKNFSTLLTAFYSDTEFGTEEVNLYADTARTQPVDPFERKTFSNIRDLTSTNTKGIIFETNYALSNSVDFTAVTAYSDMNSLQIFDQDFTAEGLPDGSLLDVSVDNLSQEVRFTYNNDGAFSGLFGLYYFKSDDMYNLQNNISTDLEPFLPLFPAEVLPQVPDFFVINVLLLEETEVENKALFFEGDYQLSKSWKLMAGLRYDKEEQKLGNNNTYTPSPDTPQFVIDALAAFIPSNLDNEGSTSYEAWLPSFGISYNINEDVLTSISVKHAYRAGGTDFNLFRNTIVEYDPEYTWTYEFALRSKWLDGKFFANTNVYYTDWEDQQVFVFLSDLSDFDRQIENAGQSRLYGAEIELTAYINDELKFFLSASHSKTEFKEFVTDDLDLSGNEFRFAPEQQVVFGGTYRGDSGLMANLDASYASSSYDNPQNREGEDDLDSYFIVNAKIGYTMDNYGLYLYGRNIFDQEYVRNRGSMIMHVSDAALYGVQLEANF